MVKCWFYSFRFGFVYSRVLNWVLISVGESVVAYQPVTFPIGGGKSDDVETLLAIKKTWQVCEGQSWVLTLMCSIYQSKNTTPDTEQNTHPSIS